MYSGGVYLRERYLLVVCIKTVLTFSVSMAVGFLVLLLIGH
jgi:hypothetical protein